MNDHSNFLNGHSPILIFSGNSFLTLECSHDLDGRFLGAVIVGDANATDAIVQADITVELSGSFAIVALPDISESVSDDEKRALFYPLVPLHSPLGEKNILVI